MGPQDHTNQRKSTKRKARKRECLRCGKKFKSWGKQNRICTRCHRVWEICFSGGSIETVGIPGDNHTKRRSVQ